MKRFLAALMTTTFLVGCSPSTTTDPDPSTATTPEAESAPQLTTATSTQLHTAESTASAEKTTTSSSSSKDEDLLAEVIETFGSLAPAQLFESLEGCAPNGIPDSYYCDGESVGQFQFFDSDVKATSTAQVLRELSSSRIMEESGNKLVGWSALGSTAIITVVEERKGLVMQQMISSDKVDPEERIEDLGLISSDN